MTKSKSVLPRSKLLAFALIASPAFALSALTIHTHSAVTDSQFQERSASLVNEAPECEWVTKSDQGYDYRKECISKPASSDAKQEEKSVESKVIVESDSNEFIEPTEQIKDIQPKDATDFLTKSSLDDLLKFTDIDHLKLSHATALGYTKGRVLSLRAKLGEYGKQLKPTTAASSALMDAASSELTLQINKIKSPNFDTAAFLGAQLDIIDRSHCIKLVSTDSVRLSMQSIHFQCEDTEVTFRVERDPTSQAYYLTGIKSSQVNTLSQTLDRLEMGEIFL